MDRNFYYIGIAFFGMINGLFNQLWLFFALIYTQQLAGPLFFGSVSLTLLFCIADGVDGHHHPRRHPGCHLRALRRAPRTIPPRPRYGSGSRSQLFWRFPLPEISSRSDCEAARAHDCECSFLAAN